MRNTLYIFKHIMVLLNSFDLDHLQMLNIKIKCKGYYCIFLRMLFSKRCHYKIMIFYHYVILKNKFLLKN